MGAESNSNSVSAERPLFCPRCGSRLEEAHDFVQPYSVAENRVFHLWCHACNGLSEVVFVRRVLAYEPEH